MSKIFEIKPIFIDIIPKELEEGKLYISKKYGVAVHLCACGCKGKTVTPLEKNGKGWTLVDNDRKVTLRPSIGNWLGGQPYHANYYITNNKIIWL